LFTSAHADLERMAPSPVRLAESNVLSSAGLTWSSALLLLGGERTYPGDGAHACAAARLLAGVRVLSAMPSAS
jgi:hypothetical protein